MDSTNQLPPFPQNGPDCEYIQSNVFHLVYGEITEYQQNTIITHIKCCEPCRELFEAEFEFRNIFCSMTDDCKICPDGVKSRLQVFLGDPGIDKIADIECNEEKISIPEIEVLNRLASDSKISHRKRLLSVIQEELSKFTDDDKK
ncbi:MAG: hypothetical protein K8S87_06825 [Planctomycetes bacterium]|nr:hypothetical protein [Planctomycetota bacterium]